MTSALSIKLGLTGLAQVQAGLRGLSNDVSRGFASLRGFALSATAALAGFAGVAGIGAAVRAGVGFNSQLENLRISLAATMKQLRPDAFKTWDAALMTSGAVVELLHAKARDLRVDFEDVAKAFQAFTADATRAGVGLEDQVTLITTLAQATSALGLKGDALATEARGLLGGAEMRAALTTKLLGVTKAELQDARERGEIFDFLMGKMGTYGELAERAARTWERASGDFKESIVMQLGDATRRLTELGTDSAMAMSKAIDASGVGDKVNAWVGAFAEAWQTQKLADFLALSVEAAFEALGDTLRGTFHGLFAALGTDWWKHAFLGVVGLGQALAKTLTEAVTWAAQPIAAFATWASDQLRVAFVTAWDGFRQSAAGAVNWVIEAFEKVEAMVKRALSALPLPVSPVPSQYRRVDFGGGEAVREAQTWQAAMENAGRARIKMLDDVGAWFVTARDDAKALLGLERASLDTEGKRVSAVDRLNEAWARFRKQNGQGVLALPKVGPADTGTAFDLERTEATLKRQLLDIERERARIEGDFRTTEAEKFQARKEGLAREQAALTEILRTLRERVAIETDPAVAEAMRARIDAHEREAFARERSLQSLGPDPSSWSDQFSASLTDLRNQFGTLQQSVARGFRSVVGGAVDSVASGIKGLIAQTMTWADALQNIAGGILNSVIDAISRMFAEWIVGRLLASNVAKAASVEEGATDAAAKAPGALFSSISSWGVAAVIGIGAVIAGLAALSGAFAEGGRPPVGRPALVGELGPEIFVPDRPGTILPNTMLGRDFEGGPSAPQEKPAISNAVNVAMFDSRLDARKWAQSQEAEVWFVDMARPDFEPLEALVTRETLDGVAFYLLAEMPAWPSPLRATFELPVASEVGLSQRETRRPLGATLRTRLSFAVVTSGAAARALAAGLRALRDEPVAVPFWPGAVHWPARDAAPFAAGWSLAITRDGGTFEAWSGTPPTWPSGKDLHVPLLVGKIETRPATWSSGESFRFEVEFEETSDAGLALNVAATQWPPGPAPAPSWAGSVPVLLPFQVAFERPTLGARVDVERERVGLGRGEAVTFYEQPSRHEGAARLSLPSREDVARFVRFFLEHGAGVPFWLPFWNQASPLSADLPGGATSASVGAGHGFAEGDWLCLTNGTALAFAQVTGATESSLALDRAPGAWKANRTRLARLALCRTERPKVTVEWASPEAAGVVFDVREVSAEYNLPAGEIRGETIGALGPRAFLYDLSVATVAGPVVERFTSFERDLEVDGNTYRAAQIEHGVIRQGLALDRDEVELRAVPDEGDTDHPLAALAALASGGPVSVTVRFVNLPNN